MVRKILVVPDKKLRKSNKYVLQDPGGSRSYLPKVIQDMKDTLAEAGGVGLAAPQIGENIQIFIMEPNMEHSVFIDPEFIYKSENTGRGFEACLSIPNTMGIVRRSKRVIIRAYDENFQEFILDTKDLEEDEKVARIIQHEMDHLNGRLFTDWATEVMSNIVK